MLSIDDSVALSDGTIDSESGVGLWHRFTARTLHIQVDKARITKADEWFVDS